MTSPTALEVLALRCEQAGAADNALDVEIECALFVRDVTWDAIRPNAAGTKVIYTDTAGKEHTFWAEDYTQTDSSRARLAVALRRRARAAQGDQQ